MSDEFLLRAAAVVAATALLAAPHWRYVARKISAAAKPAKPYAPAAARIAAACLLIVSARGAVPLPHVGPLTPQGVVAVLRMVVGIALVGYATSDAASRIRAAITRSQETTQP